MVRRNIINESTLALLPVRHIEYQTKVIEMNDSYYVRETPMELLHIACATDWVRYDDRRDYVMKRTGIKKSANSAKHL